MTNTKTKPIRPTEEERKKIERTKIIEAKKDGLQQGIQEGIEQGIEQGQQKRNVEIAKNMLLKNIDIKIISEVTGLTIQKIDDLK